MKEGGHGKRPLDFKLRGDKSNQGNYCSLGFNRKKKGGEDQIVVSGRGKPLTMSLHNAIGANRQSAIRAEWNSTPSSRWGAEVTSKRFVNEREER